MRVLLDGRLLVRRPSGVGDVAAGLHEGLTGLAKNSEISLRVAVDQAASGVHATYLPQKGFMHWHLPRAARKFGADLIVVPRQTRPLVSPVPVRPVIHDVGFLRMPEEYGESRAISFSTRYAIARSQVAVVSEFTLQEMRTQGFSGDAAVLPIQAIHRVEPQRVPSAPYLLTVGVQNRHKNLARLIRAWDAAETGAYELWICAKPGNDSEEFDRALSSSSKAGSIRVVGGLDQASYMEMLGAAHAYVQPSLYEGLGIPMLDVAAAGVPVVGSSWGNTGSVLGASNVGLTFDPVDVSAMAQAIEKVLHDVDFRNEASHWLTQNIGLTDWEAVARAAIR